MDNAYNKYYNYPSHNLQVKENLKKIYEQTEKTYYTVLASKKYHDIPIQKQETHINIPNKKKFTRQDVFDLKGYTDVYDAGTRQIQEESQFDPDKEFIIGLKFNGESEMRFYYECKYCKEAFYLSNGWHYCKE